MVITGNPTECERCGCEEFTFHTDPTHPERDHFLCVSCEAYYYVYEVGHFDLLDYDAQNA